MREFTACVLLFQVLHLGLKSTLSLFVFKVYFIDYANRVVPLSPLYHTPPCTPPSLQHCPPLVHVNGLYILSSLVSSFPILFWTSPCPFVPTNYASYSLYLFSLFFPYPLPTDNLPCDLYFCDSVLAVGVCLVFVFGF